MDFEDIKKPLMIYVILLLLIGIYISLFGSKNLVIPIIIFFTTISTTRSDFSLTPKLSFLKILLVFWACAIVAFINTPNNILGLGLGFILIFIVTASSVRVLTNNSHVPYLLSYVMMMSSSVTIEQMPLRLLGLAVGALIIVALNLFMNRSKRFDTKKDMVFTLLDDLILVIDAKLNDEEYDSTIPKINNNVDSLVFENLGYKYANNFKRESLIAMCKTAEYILDLINRSNFTQEELKQIKDNIIKVKKNMKIVRQGNESEQLSLVLMHLEIIESEFNNMKESMDNTYDLRNISIFLKNRLSFSSLEVSFALKLSFLISLWEMFGLLFGLPYVKWLYYSSIALLKPYSEQVTKKSKLRFKATFYGVTMFVVVVIAFFSDYSIFNLLNISISKSVILTVFLLLLALIVLIYFKDTLRRTSFLTLFALTLALQYIDWNMAISIRVLWLIGVAVVVNVLSRYIMPYSIRKETMITLNICSKVNDNLIDLLKKQLMQEKILSKAGLIVSSNVISRHVKSNNRSLQDSNIERINKIQDNIAIYCDFLLNSIQIGKLDKKAKENIFNILEGNEVNDSDDMCYDEKLSINITKHILKFKQEEERLLNNIH